MKDPRELTPLDTTEIDGNMPYQEDNLEPYLEDPFAAGAAMVTKKGMPLSQVTEAERHRFRIAFYRAYAAISPEQHAEIQKLREGSTAFAPNAACGARSRKA